MPKSGKKRAARKERQSEKNDGGSEEAQTAPAPPTSSAAIASALFQTPDRPSCCGAAADGDAPTSSYGAFDMGEYYRRGAVPSSSLERELVERSRQAQCSGAKPAPASLGKGFSSLH